jgi:hypothetical protein
VVGRTGVINSLASGRGQQFSKPSKWLTTKVQAQLRFGVALHARHGW